MDKDDASTATTSNGKTTHSSWSNSRNRLNPTDSHPQGEEFTTETISSSEIEKPEIIKEDSDKYQMEKFEQVCVEMNRCDCASILIVDDDGMNRLVLSSVLGQSGIKVDEAVNGVAAISKVEERWANNSCCPSFGTIIMDFEMPLMTGPTATKKLHEMAKDGEILPQTIIGHTAYGSKNELELFRSAGIVDILPKPIKKISLVKLLNKHWTRGNSRSSISGRC
mmetsp:Transcript_696/g.737  ORF Transcript_696/g.737 Transcript_696/m.737 type:complete len:223 (-) Transcript_696:26-694(-)